LTFIPHFISFLKHCLFCCFFPVVNCFTLCSSKCLLISLSATLAEQFCLRYLWLSLCQSGVPLYARVCACICLPASISKPFPLPLLTVSSFCLPLRACLSYWYYLCTIKDQRRLLHVSFSPSALCPLLSFPALPCPPFFTSILSAWQKPCSSSPIQTPLSSDLFSHSPEATLRRPSSVMTN